MDLASNPKTVADRSTCPANQDFQVCPSSPSLAMVNLLTNSSATQFWLDLYTPEIPSKECLSRVQSLLSCPTKITVARSFQGNEAQRLVDFLDRVSKLCYP